MLDIFLNQKDSLQALISNCREMTLLQTSKVHSNTPCKLCRWNYFTIYISKMKQREKKYAQI